jgi:hypothetical protein
MSERKPPIGTATTDFSVRIEGAGGDGPAGVRVMPCARVAAVRSYALSEDGTYVDVLLRSPAGADFILRIEIAGFGMIFDVFEKIMRMAIAGGAKAAEDQVQAYKLNDWAVLEPRDPSVDGGFLQLNPKTPARAITYLVDDAMAKELGAALVRMQFNHSRQARTLMKPTRRVLRAGTDSIPPADDEPSKH